MPTDIISNNLWVYVLLTTPVVFLTLMALAPEDYSSIFPKMLHANSTDVTTHIGGEGLVN
ncbi:hypothetical protein LXA43DRAFT_1103563 [Ganoderma leucocontextum]|nr:hypothetical protein LXA43DRAFT_1103563 [Ganoderma leucocontextum]